MAPPRRGNAQAAAPVSRGAAPPQPAAGLGAGLLRPALGPLAAAAVLLAGGGAAVVAPPKAEAQLPTSTSQVKNAKALLRYSLPLQNKPLREIQFQLETISEALRVPGVKFSDVKKAVGRSEKVLRKERKQILEAVPAQQRAYADGLLNQLDAGLKEFDVINENKDRQEVPIIQQKLLGIVGLVEEAAVKDADGHWVVPFSVPAEYDAMPQLRGRATLKMEVKIKDPRERGLDSDGNAEMTIVLDGLNAPVSSGNMVDLVQRRFYDGMEIQRADGFVVQTGDPDGPATGFVDPKTKEPRTVPFEVRVKGDKLPLYEETMEDVGRANEIPVLPFNAYGTLAMERAEFEPNSASSQIFWLLKDSESAVGRRPAGRARGGRIGRRLVPRTRPRSRGAPTSPRTTAKKKSKIRDSDKIDPKPNRPIRGTV